VSEEEDLWLRGNHNKCSEVRV